jgi:hypothetical protein
MAGKKFTNAEAEADRSKKADNAAVKTAAEERVAAQAEEASWQKGANTKKAARDESASSKADEAARKRREKEEPLAAEEADQTLRERTATTTPATTVALLHPNHRKSSLNDLLTFRSEATMSGLPPLPPRGVERRLEKRSRKLLDQIEQGDDPDRYGRELWREFLALPLLLLSCG